MKLEDVLKEDYERGIGDILKRSSDIVKSSSLNEMKKVEAAGHLQSAVKNLLIYTMERVPSEKVHTVKAAISEALRCMKVVSTFAIANFDREDGINAGVRRCCRRYVAKKDGTDVCASSARAYLKDLSQLRESLEDDPEVFDRIVESLFSDHRAWAGYQRVVGTALLMVAAAGAVGLGAYATKIALEAKKLAKRATEEDLPEVREKIEEVRKLALEAAPSVTSTLISTGGNVLGTVSGAIVNALGVAVGVLGFVGLVLLNGGANR